MLLGVPAAGARLWTSAGTTLAVCAAVGNSHLVSLCPATGPVRRAWSRGGTDPVERRQAPRDLRHDGLPGPLGPAAELAGDGTHLPDQLGVGLPFGGMVCAMGLGAPATVRDPGTRRGRDSLGPRVAGRQLPDRDLSNRRALPPPPVGRQSRSEKT